MIEETKPRKLLVLQGWIEGDPVYDLSILLFTLKDETTGEYFFSAVGVQPNHLEGVIKALNRLKPLRITPPEKPLVEVAT